jgi:hypothetical protein
MVICNTKYKAKFKIEDEYNNTASNHNIIWFGYAYSQAWNKKEEKNNKYEFEDDIDWNCGYIKH